MGTNYYARLNHCKHCDRGDEKHIGKSSLGWTFAFHATTILRSYRDWLEVLSEKDVKIFDEYGFGISLKDFKELVNSKRDSKHNHARDYPGDDYLDEEGNCMMMREFS